MRRAILLACVVLAGCALDLFGPDVRYVNRRPMVPVPAVYPQWYMATAKCLAMLGEIDAVRWFVADSIFWEGGLVPALTSGDEITISVDFAYAWPMLTIRHESAHHITGKGVSLHLPDGGVVCDGAH